MANIKDRPYVGTWKLQSRQLVQHTPDMLVYVNGSLSLPGCPDCKGRIPLQQYVTEVSTDAGVEPASASGSFTLSIPLHSNESFARDAKFLLKPGLEVHFYARGYFPVKGLYSNLGEAQTRASISSLDPPTKEEREGKIENPREVVDSYPSPSDDSRDNPPHKDITLTGIYRRKRRGETRRIIIHESGLGSAGTEVTFQQNGTGCHYTIDRSGHVRQYADHNEVVYHTPNNNLDSIGIEVMLGGGTEVIEAGWAAGGKYRIPSEGQLDQVWGTVYAAAEQEGIPVEFGSQSGDSFTFAAAAGGTTNGISSHQGQTGNHADGNFPLLYMAIRARGYSSEEAYSEAKLRASGLRAGGTVQLPPVKGDASVTTAKEPDQSRRNFTNKWPLPRGRVRYLSRDAQKYYGILGTSSENGFQGTGAGEDERYDPLPFKDLYEEYTSVDLQVNPSLLERLGLNGLGVEDVLAYPYYHVFHGVVTQVSHNWSGGVNTVSVQCASILHFWQYHKLITNDPLINNSAGGGSKAAISEHGHVLSGWHPYQIIWWCYHTMHKGGMEEAVDTATNQNAQSSVTGDYLWHLARDYWAQRFNSGFNNLRMHGVTGSLFSSAQAALLGRTSSAQLTTAMRRKIANRSGKKGARRLDALTALNVGDAEALTLLARGGPDGGSADVDINMVEIKAFVDTVSQFGQFSFWEAPYTSKLDVVQRVCEVTQFEFFQDVDGDFVFKPKMYNLDTSSSRIYRIEDIDIISISFSEQEPQATYARVKSAHPVKNIDISLAQNLGRISTYIDWRLVAQFGYRPFDFETSYTTDPKAMFYIAMNRLDVLNAPTRTANVTIPQRPELRPGYPVYIPYLDCFYYLTNFSHSFSVGGQCTTALQLQARRAKFFAPGDPLKRGIDAIDFTKGSLPDRPLSILGKDGLPRLSGFPNVVLAMDPNRTSPLHIPGGVFLNKLKNEEDLRNLLKLGSRQGVGVLEEQPDGSYTFDALAGYDAGGKPLKKTVRFYFQGDESAQTKSRGEAKGVSTTNVDFVKAFQTYQKKYAGRPLNLGDLVKDAAAQKVKDLKVQLQILDAEIFIASTALSLGDTSQTTQLTALQEKRSRIQNEIAKWEGAASGGEGVSAVADEVDQGVRFIMQFLEMLGERMPVALDDRGARNVQSASYMDLLWDLKANFGNASWPGHFRYYSCSHPDPQHQGQDIMQVVMPEGGGPSEMEKKPAILNVSVPVEGYVRNPSLPFQGTMGPEAELGEVQAERGIYIYTTDGPAVVPTSDILTLSFVETLVKGRKQATSTTGFGGPVAELKGLRQGEGPLSADTLGRAPAETDTISGAFKSRWDSLWGDFLRSYVSVRKRVSTIIPALSPFPSISPDTTFPSTLRVGAASIPTSVALMNSGFKTTQTVRKKEIPGYLLTGKTKLQTAEQVWEEIGEALSALFLLRDSQALTAWTQKVHDASKGAGAALTKDQAELITGMMKNLNASSLGVLSLLMDRTRETKAARYTTTVRTPVFPISDAQGYEVIGSQQYGRGLDVEPGGVWDSLRAQDPLSAVDTRTLDLAIHSLIMGKTLYETEEGTLTKELPGNRKVKTRKATKAQARTKLERQILEGLRRNYSDQQLLDLGILQTTATPNQFTFNMGNLFATGRDGVQKLPLINAALSLSEITAQQDQQVCNCKSQEAGILLEAFGQKDFLGFAPGGQAPGGPSASTGDQVSDWLLSLGLQASADWKVRQDVYRGTSQATKNATGLLQSTLSSAETLRQTVSGEAVQQQRAQVAFERAKIEGSEVASASAQRLRDLGEE